MTVALTIQRRTNDGETVVDFLIDVMQDERDGFKICHRLDAAKLLTKYGCSCAKSAVAERSEAFDFILDNPPEPSRRRAGSGASSESEFDTALAKVIRESTDDGRSVCRFLINVMDGELKAFKPHHRIAAARELLSRGFGKGARAEAAAYTPRPASTPSAPARAQAPDSSFPRENVTPYPDTGRESTPSSNSDFPEEDPTAVAIAEADPDDETHWDKVWEALDPFVEESERRKAVMAEQGIDSDDPSHVPDLSAFNEAWENSEKWFHEWKDSLDPEEYRAIISEGAARFDSRLEMRAKRRKQIAEDRERRGREEAERQAQQAKAEVDVESEPDEPPVPDPPPTREEHEYISSTPNVPTSYFYKKCGHPKCTVCNKPRYYPEDDRSSPYYFDGRAPPMYGSYGL